MLKYSPTDKKQAFGRDIEALPLMINKKYIIIFAGVILLLVGLISCAKLQGSHDLNFAGLMVSNRNVPTRVAPGSFAFYSFIKNLSAPSTDALQGALHEEAKNFFPDSTMHPGLSLFGVELAYTDSIRLLYYEFSKAVPPESYAYLSSFTKGGLPIEVLPLKEASFNGNAAVNIIDDAVLELEYYDVYTREGHQEEELAFEYYQIEADGHLSLLSTPSFISEEREYLEASARLLSMDELKRYEARELKILELELLAQYGQVFSDPKWQSYFEKTNWYLPRDQEAEALLSGLEKINLQKIRQLQINF